jgi:hypothetical protein
MRTQHRKRIGEIVALLIVLALHLPTTTRGQISVSTITAPVNTLSIPDLDYLYATTPKWLFTITLTSPTVVDVVMTITLHVQLAEGLQYTAAGRFISEPFTLNRTRTITNLELGRGRGIPQRLVDGYVFDESAKQKFLEIALPSGTMPAGSYRFVVDVQAVDGSTSDADEFTFVLTNPSSPILLTPGEGETVTEEFPLFEWQYDGPRATISIYEQLPGQRSLEETASGTPHATATVATRSFRYPSTGVRPLQQGKTYVWHVTGLVGVAGGTSVQQRSALRSFTVSANKRYAFSWILAELEGALPPSYKPVFEQIRAQNLSPSGTFRLNGSPISVSDLLSLLNELRSNPESIGAVDLE